MQFFSDVIRIIQHTARVVYSVCLASPGDCVSIDWPAEKEQTGCARIEWDSDRHQHTLAGSKHSTRWTEGNLPWDIREGQPVQITLVARPGKHSCKADEGPVFIAVKMSNDAHRQWPQVKNGRCTRGRGRRL